ncbi:MAG TPA: DUF2723 domain-containing protein, partial [Bacteroidetes bacterium]|nr:DUF2723 domain-containing protein [Bacteroidota bacterium]
SSFFTSLVVWAIFKWENVSDDSRANRWLVFIAFIMGVSIGVHLLNLLTIPALAFVYYFKRFKPSRLGIISAGVISIIILGFIQFVVILKMPEAITTAELFFTNTLGMPFNTGSWFIVFISLTFILVGVWATHKYEEDIDYALSGSVISGFDFRTSCEGTD